MIRKIIKKIHSGIKAAYHKDDVLVQKRALVFVNLVLLFLFLVPIVIAAYLVFKDFDYITHGVLLFFEILFVVFIYMTLKGKYQAASSGFCLIVSLFFAANTFVAYFRGLTSGMTPAVFSDQIYYSVAIIITALFCSRFQVFMTGLMYIIISLYIGFHSIPLMDEKVISVSRQLNSDIVGSVLFISIFSFSFLSLFNNIIQIINSGKNEVMLQYKKIQDFLAVISDVSGEMSVTVEEMSAGALQLSENSQIQSKRVDEINSIIEKSVSAGEYSSNTVQNQQENVISLISKSSDLYELVSEINEKVQSAVLTKEQLVETINKSGLILNECKSYMDVAREGALHASESMAIINDISDMINLLSLNASIEAARAGVHGSGFAIVAEEISKLSDETQKNSREITGTVADTADLINRTGDELHKVTNVATKIREGTESFGQIFDGIAKLTEKDLEMNKSIQKYAENVIAGSDELKTAIENQKRFSIGISDALQSISQSAQILAAGSEEFVATSENVEASTSRLKGILGSGLVDN